MVKKYLDVLAYSGDYTNLCVELKTDYILYPRTSTRYENVITEICKDKQSRIYIVIHSHNGIIYKELLHNSVCINYSDNPPYLINLLEKGITYNEESSINVALPLLYFKLAERKINHYVMIYYPKHIVDLISNISEHELVNNFTLGFVLHYYDLKIDNKFINFINKLSISFFGRELEQVEHRGNEIYIAFPHTGFIDGISKYSIIASVAHLILNERLLSFELHLAHTSQIERLSDIVDAVLLLLNKLLNLIGYTIYCDVSCDRIIYADYYGLSPRRLVYVSRNASLARALETVVILVQTFTLINEFL